MKLKVNGEEREVEVGTTVTALLDSLGLNRDGVAVAVAGHVVPRTQHPERELQDGEAVEVIRAVGGG